MKKTNFLAGAALTVMTLALTQPLMAKDRNKGGFVEETVTIVSVADAKNMKDDAYVVLQGTIHQNLGDENYLFKDDSGTVVIEIDDDDWNGVTVGPQDIVMIKGQVDKGWTNVEIDVDEISKVNPATK
mgnify:FL=1